MMIETNQERPQSEECGFHKFINSDYIHDSLNQIVGRKARRQLKNLSVYIEADRIFQN